MADWMSGTEAWLKENWWWTGAISAIQLGLVYTKTVKLDKEKTLLWTIFGILGLGAAGWGLMMNQAPPSSGYTYYYDGNYYFA